MKRFLGIVLSVRGLLMLAIVVAATCAGLRYSAHHEAENVFEQLYMHLVPAPLVVVEGEAHGAHAEPHPLVEVPLPRSLALIDWRGGRDPEHPTTVLYNTQIFQLAAVVLILIGFLGVPRAIRSGRGDPLSKLFAGFALWVRDEMVYPQMGKALGRKFLPYFLTLFFFVLFMNVVGLLPFSATATASIFVTGALALTTFVGMLVCGMVAQGPVAFWKNLVPHVPLALWPIMFVVEVIGLLVKPFALTIRLFANMSGGHMVVLSFMGLIFFLGSTWGAAGGWGASPIGVGFAVFIMIIESFVAMLQAFIFTQLSIIFIQSSVHPGH